MFVPGKIYGPYGYYFVLDDNGYFWTDTENKSRAINVAGKLANEFNTIFHVVEFKNIIHSAGPVPRKV